MKKTFRCTIVFCLLAMLVAALIGCNNGNGSSAINTDNVAAENSTGSVAGGTGGITGSIGNGGTYYITASDGSVIAVSPAYDSVFFENYGVNPFVYTADDNLSTFAVDVDTASYAVCRKYLNSGQLPPVDAVRTEEFLNYFDYQYAPPETNPFAIYLEGSPSQFGPEYKMLRIGIQGKDVSQENRKDAILTFVIDISGSMVLENRLGLVKRSLHMLLDKLKPSDKIGIVIFSATASVLMTHRGIEDKGAILTAINSLEPTETTNAYAGLMLGYQQAESVFQVECVNRLILCSDGVANVDMVTSDEMLAMADSYLQKGISLSTIGFGMGNYNDVLMEQLADNGNGNYAYVDTILEANKVLIQNLTGMLQITAKDAKVQVDFNSEVVRSYRLLGYENRAIADDDFSDDTVDGGEIGAGHSVTVLYEIELWAGAAGKAATLYIRSKDPDTDIAAEVSQEIYTDDFKSTFEETSGSFKLSAAVAEFAEILRQSYWSNNTPDDVLQVMLSLPEEFTIDPEVTELADLITATKTLKQPGSSYLGK